MLLALSYSVYVRASYQRHSWYKALLGLLVNTSLCAHGVALGSLSVCKKNMS
jgi:hypothetical protein